MTGVAVGESPWHEYVGYGRGRHDDGGYLQGEHHPTRGSNPQEVATHQQRGYPQARRLVLPDDGVRTLTIFYIQTFY